MAKGNEGKLIDKVHRQLDPSIYKLKMNMGMGAPAGIADMFYEGDKDDLFVEYKVVNDWETKRVIPMKQLTLHQSAWIQRRMKNNRPMGIIIGDLKGRIFWIDRTNYKDPKKPLVIDMWTPKQAAAKIKEMVMHERGITNTIP